MIASLKIGIAAMNFGQPGEGGGLSIYVRQLAEALADFDPINRYSIFLYEYSMHSWNSRAWPANVKLVTLQQHLPTPSRRTRIGQIFKRALGVETPVVLGGKFVAQQIDAHKLDLVHFPCTTIFPLSVNSRTTLTFFDLQQEYYPEFFTQSVLDERAQTYRASVDKAIRIAVPSLYTQQSLIEKFEVLPAKLVLVPVGIRDSVQRAEPGEVARIKAKYNLPESYLYYPANPWPHKNHARLLAALRLYRERYSTSPILVTSGRLRDEMRDVKTLAADAGVEDSVMDLGFVPLEDIVPLYSGATLLVFPSLFEGFGIPLLEAMACGCPIAAANATAIPGCVGDAAMLFDPCDSGAIADTIHQLMLNDSLRHDLSRKGLERARQFHWQNVIPQLTAMFAEAVNRN